MILLIYYVKKKTVEQCESLSEVLSSKLHPPAVKLQLGWQNLVTFDPRGRAEVQSHLSAKVTDLNRKGIFAITSWWSSVAEVTLGFRGHEWQKNTSALRSVISCFIQPLAVARTCLRHLEKNPVLRNVIVLRSAS